MQYPRPGLFHRYQCLPLTAVYISILNSEKKETSLLCRKYIKRKIYSKLQKYNPTNVFKKTIGAETLGYLYNNFIQSIF